MKFDYTALRGRIKERFGTYRSFAAALGVSDRTLRRWLQCKPDMPIRALYRMVEILEIPDCEVEFYFFSMESTTKITQEIVENIGRMSSDLIDLFIRFMNCLIAMRENKSAEVIQANDRLQAAIAAGATLDEVARHTEALELALGIRQANTAIARPVSLAT
ncbi:MAG: DUF739 family protein [Candidatus Limivicinus sp.]